MRLLNPVVGVVLLLFSSHQSFSLQKLKRRCSLYLLTNDWRAVLNPLPLYNAVKTLCIHEGGKKKHLKFPT